MTIILIFLILTLLTCLISLLSGHKFEECLPVSIFAIIIILYASGFTGNLELGVNLILVFTAVCIPMCTYFLIKHKKQAVSLILTPGSLAFCLFFLLFWWWCRNRMLITWDEFSHWGLAVKNMYALNTFTGNSASTDAFKDYPPATALLEYFWVKVTRSFEEGNLLRASDILIVSLMLPVFRNLDWSKWKRIPIIFILILIVPCSLYNDVYVTLYVDAVLGLIFGYVIYCYFLSRRDAFLLVNLSCALFVLTITKSSGAGLALITLLILVGDHLFFRRKDILWVYKGNKKKTALHLVVYLLPLLSFLTAYYSWKIYLKSMKIGVSFSSSKSVFDNLNQLIWHVQAYQNTTIDTFLNAFYNQNFSGSLVKLSIAGWIALIAVLALIFYKLNDTPLENKKSIYLLVSLGVSFLIYSTTLLYLYLFCYSQYEATIVASFDRYFGTILIGLILPLVAIIIIKTNDRKMARRQWFKYPVIGVLFIFLAVTDVRPRLWDTTLYAPELARSTAEARISLDSVEKILKVVKPENNLLEYISIADKGYDFWVARYDLTPLPLGGPWSIGKPYYTGDIWTQDLTPQQWQLLLNGSFTYVYVHKVNDSFINTYSGVFKEGKASIRNDQLYYVDKSSGIAMLESCNVN